MNTYSTAAITATETTRFIPVDMGTILYGFGSSEEDQMVNPE